MLSPLIRQRGFTLLEVLITMVILAVGLLGLAKLQVAGLRFTHDSYLRSQATAHAYDLVDRVRANPDGLADGNYTNPQTASTDCLAEACTSAQLAAYDMNEWQTTIQTGLPGGTGAITQVTGSSDLYTIVVDWSEGRLDATDDVTDDSRFQLNIRAE